MTEAETEFLALLALGMFSVDEDGKIWRHKEWGRGSKIGAAPAIRALRKTRRADVSRSGRRHAGSTSYLRVMFVSKGRRWKVNAHRVVWMIANGRTIPDGLEINHRNGNGEDNRPQNLEVVSASQNMTHAIRTLGVPRKARAGTANPSATLTNDQVMEIRRLSDLKTMPQREIGALYGVSQQTVANIHKRKTWRHLPGQSSAARAAPRPARSTWPGRTRP